MFKKTVEGVRKFLEKAFGKKKPNKKFEDLVDVLDQGRKDRIEAKTKELKKEMLNDGLMHMSKLGKADVILSEAITTTKYLDPNVWTIGIGATKSEIKDLRRWPIDKEMSLESIFELFDKGLEKYARGVRKALKVEVSQHMFDGLVSFAYNIGIRGMANSSLVKAINRGVTDKRQLKAYLMRWNKIKKGGRLVVSRGLINRRNAEAEVMFEGRYKNKRMIGRVVPVSSKSHQPMYRSKRVKTIDLNKYL